MQLLVGLLIGIHLEIQQRVIQEQLRIRILHRSTQHILHQHHILHLRLHHGQHILVGTLVILLLIQYTLHGQRARVQMMGDV